MGTLIECLQRQGAQHSPRDPHPRTPLLVKNVPLAELKAASPRGPLLSPQVPLRHCPHPDPVTAQWDLGLLKPALLTWPNLPNRTSADQRFLVTSEAISLDSAAFSQTCFWKGLWAWGQLTPVPVLPCH